MTDEHSTDGSSPATGCWYLSGATAVGKTQVGLALAKRIGAEIVSLDSMAIYRGMDIGTAKPSLADRAEVGRIRRYDGSAPRREWPSCYVISANG